MLNGDRGFPLCCWTMLSHVAVCLLYGNKEDARIVKVHGLQEEGRMVQWIF